MPNDARQIANWFVDRASADGTRLSVMSLLKLVYIAHGWHLEVYGQPLIKNRIEAWKYGPVIPDVYAAFRKQGIDVTGKAAVDEPDLDQSVEQLLEQIYNVYSKLSAFELSDITHVDGGPWDIATKSGGYYANIPNELIQQHYESKRARARSA